MLYNGKPNGSPKCTPCTGEYFGASRVARWIRTAVKTRITRILAVFSTIISEANVAPIFK